MSLIGKTLGPYRIVDQIGVGGMATVYKAYQPGMDRYVAVKTLPYAQSHDEQFVRRFQREVRAISRLEHAHIVPVYDYGEADNTTYIVLRYVEAGSLRDLMKNGPLPLEEINRIIGQISSALEYAHRLGVVHRDIKPGNVLIDDQGNTYLTDFGIAYMMGASHQLTGTGMGIGTPAYMAPEQGQGHRVDHRCDIYALGVLLYELVTGHLPFEADTPMAVIYKHIHEPLPLPRRLNPDLPEAVERVILKALAKDPVDRYQNAGDFAHALNLAVRQASNEQAQRKTMPASAKQVVTVPRFRTIRTWPFKWVAGLAVPIMALAGFGLWLSQLPYRIQIADGQLQIIAQQGTFTPTSTSLPTEALTIPISTPISSTNTPRPTSTRRPSATPDPVDLAWVLTNCLQDFCVGQTNEAARPLGIGSAFTDEWAPSWSPDGTEIIFEACRQGEDLACVQPGHTDIYRVKSDGTESRLFLADGRYPTWSPSGEWIVFVGINGPSLIRPDGTEQHGIVNMSEEMHWFAWSPDSQWIAWIGGNMPGGGWSTVWVVNIDGTSLHPIYFDTVRGVEYAEIAWSPDEQSVVFRTANGTIYKADTQCDARKSSCEETMEELVSFPEHWTPRYFPQWVGETLGPIPTPFAEGVLEIRRVIRSESFDNLDSPQFSLQGDGQFAINDGILTSIDPLDPSSCCASGASSRFNPSAGSASIFLFKIGDQSQLGIHLDDPGTHHFNLDGDLAGNGFDFSLQGSIAQSGLISWKVEGLKPDVWYYYVLQFQVDGEIYALIVPRDNPADKIFELHDNFGKAWVRDNFTFWIGVEHGQLDLDEYQEVELANETTTAIPTATEIIQQSTTPSPGALLFYEDFEDGDASSFSYVSGNWNVVSDDDGNWVFDMDDTSDTSGIGLRAGFGSSLWTDYAIEYRVKLINSNADIWLSFRDKNEAAYIQRLNIEFSELVLYDSWQPLIKRTYNPAQGVWYRIRVEAQGETLRVFVNGNLEIETTDSHISSGDLVIGAFPDTHAQFDDIVVTALGE